MKFERYLKEVRKLFVIQKSHKAKQAATRGAPVAKNPNEVATLRVSADVIKTVKKAISACLDYEALTDCGRKFGITGEVGEILVCRALKLRLVKDPRCAGFDALDRRNSVIQIKTRRGERSELPEDSGRLGTFSKHRCDYALMAILNRKYELVEVWRAGYKELLPIIGRHKRRNPTIRQFKNVGEQILQRI